MAADSTRRALVVGKGTAGTSLAESLRDRGETIVGFLDDRVVGPDVLGTLADVNAVLSTHPVDVIYFAIPSVDAAAVRGFLATLHRDDVEVAIIPRTYSILAKDAVQVEDLTDVDVLDLVGRQPVKQDLLAAREFVAGKTVLVTGAAGSIGSRLVRQLLDLGAGRVVGVDWSETGIFFLGQELGGNPALELRIGDITSRAGLLALLERHRPQVVFHAAAFKHVPLMQANPVEAVNNNVGGTLNVMRCAIETGVENVVFVSTDKAVNPANVMGATKRLGEMLLEALAPASATRFNAVRFGNVIQSSGSVMQIFRDQIAKKKPLTVTDPEVTRFFMTLDEACQLVIQSSFVGGPGDLYVLDMGEPVRIIDLAQSLVAAVAPDLPIVLTGLRPGEKLHEELSYEPDRVAPTSNPKIFHVRDEAAIDAETFIGEIDALLEQTRQYRLTPEALVARLREFGFPIQ
jgi:FlaA1/EpsC-like NDP-sugar epimerase